PIAQGSSEEALIQIWNLIAIYQKDLLCRYVGVIGPELLAEIHHWNWGEPHSPELLHTLREAGFISTRSFSLRLLSRCLAESLPKNVTQLDLLSRLSEKLGEEEGGCFLLGGNEKVLRFCNLYLLALYPDLKIGGTSHTTIVTKGSELPLSE